MRHVALLGAILAHVAMDVAAPAAAERRDGPRGRRPAGSWTIEARESREDASPRAKGSTEFVIEEGGTNEVEIRLAR